MIRLARLPGTHVLRLRSARCISTTVPRPMHLNPSVPTTPLGLPASPRPPPIPAVPSAPLDRAELHKLCALAALDPPPVDSPDEAQLLSELGELVGLMDLVSAVELEGDDVGGLLSAGVGEFVVGAQEREGAHPRRSVRSDGGLGSEGLIAPVGRPLTPDGQERGRMLLEYATRRVGDYYGARNEPREE